MRCANSSPGGFGLDARLVRKEVDRADGVELALQLRLQARELGRRERRESAVRAFQALAQLGVVAAAVEQLAVGGSFVAAARGRPLISQALPPSRMHSSAELLQRLLTIAAAGRQQVGAVAQRDAAERLQRAPDPHARRRARRRQRDDEESSHGDAVGQSSIRRSNFAYIDVESRYASMSSSRQFAWLRSGRRRRRGAWPLLAGRARCARSPTATWRSCCRPTCSRSASARSRSASSARRRCSARRSRRSPSAPGAIASGRAAPAARRRAADGADRRRLRRPSRRSGPCWSSPSSARSIRARATSASSCRSSTRAWRARRSGHARTRAVRALQPCSARVARRSARSPPPCPRRWSAAAASRRRSRCARCSSLYGAIGAARLVALPAPAARRRPTMRPTAPPPAPLGPSRAHRRPARRAVQRRRLRRRPGRQLADVALAARALRPLARAGRRVLLLDRAAERRVCSSPRRASRVASACSTRWSSRTSRPTSASSLAALGAELCRSRSRCSSCAARSSQMDVPTRTAYVMAVVTPAERPAAASFTAVPRSLAAALSPDPERRAPRRRLARAAAGRLRRAQDRLRPGSSARAMRQTPESSRPRC